MESTITLPVLRDGAPLYEQLYRHLVEEISGGRLSAGGKLPSKRKMCALLGVSMSTVDTAYSMLAAEGYVTVRSRSGYTVADLLPLTPSPAADTPKQDPPVKKWLYDCSTSAVDTSLFPFSSWARITKEAVYENPDLLRRGHPQGDLPLRTALADLLAQYRGVRCSPEQIIVGAGADWLLSMVLQLLPEHRAIALEDPGYPAAYATAKRLERKIISIPVDAKGMSPKTLDESGADLAYVTPSHQFPLGVTMPADRRSRLLHWAYSAPGRYIIEDDYDSEFRYSSRPIPALQGMDREERVIYMGTFSRSIAPAIRVAFTVLPPSLLKRWQDEFSHSSCTVSRFEQEALRRFLVQGLYSRHLRRSINLYRHKCSVFAEELKKIEGTTLSGQQAGLHFLLTLPRLSETELVERAEKTGIHVTPLSRYCHRLPPIPSTIVIGFAGLAEEELERTAKLLKKIYESP